MLGIADGLEYIHGKGVVHTNITKSAIKVLHWNRHPGMSVQICNFPRSKEVDVEELGDCEDVQYMPKEILVPTTKYKPIPPSDIWSAAVIGCELYMKEDYWDFPQDKVNWIKTCMKREQHSHLRERFSNQYGMPQEIIIYEGLLYEPAQRCTAKQMAKMFRDAYLSY